MNRYDTKDCIFALATAWGKGAIAVVRVSGDGCIGILDGAVLKRRSFKGLSDVETNKAVYCTLVDPSDSRPVDDVVVTLFRDGHGYTGEEALEISCHGGVQVVSAVLSLMASLGFRQALPGEFTLRAFLHGKMDLTRAEAVNEMINAQGSVGRSMALRRLNGALFRRIEEIKATVARMMSIVEVQLDYSEDEVGEDLTFPMGELDSAIEALGTIRDSYSTGRLYSQGARIVLAGPSNAGKSSLFNYFLKEDRSIVSPVKGTTRDFIEAMCTIGGIPVRLFDTAGFRDFSSGEIEDEGMRRSRNLVDSADLIIYLVDSSELIEIDESVTSDPRCIPVLNKTDIKNVDMDGFLKLSVATGYGFDSLCKAIEAKLKEGLVLADDSALVIESERQKELLGRAASSLSAVRTAVSEDLPLDIVSMDIQEALEALGELTGEVTTDDILDRIFGSFCVGK